MQSFNGDKNAKNCKVIMDVSHASIHVPMTKGVELQS